MPSAVSLFKVVGTFSLGLLTGTAYNLTTITLPSLAVLPSAARASHTLSTIQTKSTQQILTLASISSLSLITAYTLAAPRGKHPYLLWTALVGFIGGQGLEYYYNGLSRFPSVKALKDSRTTSESNRTVGGAGGGSGGYVEVENDVSVNGEKVEMEMSRERKVQAVRTLVAGLGFAMGVIGIWGDGA